jgi:ubiquinone/menaquinone biosynthesis C-methylase UbiE
MPFRSRGVPRDDAVDFHSRLATRWSSQYAKASYRRRLSLLLHLLGPSVGGQYILDAGCGSGVLSRSLRERGARVVAFDASIKMVSAAQHESRQGHARSIDFLVTRVEHLPLPADRFDAVLCSSVLEYVDDVAGALAEFRRVLRGTGRLVGSLPLEDSLLRRMQKVVLAASGRLGTPWPKYLVHSHLDVTVASLRDTLRRAGFDMTECQFWAPWPQPGSVPALATLVVFVARPVQ